MSLSQYKSTAANAREAKLVSEGDINFVGKDSNGKAATTGWRDDAFPVEFKKGMKSGRVVELWYHSPSMNRDIPLLWLRPDPKKVDQSKPMPTLYYLNGGDGGEGRANWVYQTDILNFFSNKAVNVVIPMAGQFSYYTDWVNNNNSLGGKQKWETFLTKELPGPLEKKINGNGKRGIEGMSMSGTSSLTLAAHNPGFYNAVASFSGCADTATPLGIAAVKATFTWGGRGGQDELMWGKPGNAIWRYNSALHQSHKLKNTRVYVSSATGLMGQHDTMKNFDNPLGAGWVRAVGGGIEAATNACTHDLKVKMDREGSSNKTHFEFRNSGVHSWPYWQDDMKKSWRTTFGPAFGLK